MNISWLKNLKYLRTAKTVKTVGTVSKMSKIGGALKELPVVRIIAGSAVGVVIIDTWKKSVDTISDVLGTSDDVSALMLGCIAALVLALIVSSVISIRRRS